MHRAVSTCARTTKNEDYGDLAAIEDWLANTVPHDNLVDSRVEIQERVLLGSFW